MKKTLLTVLLIGVLVTMLTAVPRNKVIVEIATGTGCPYCPGSAMGADDLVENGHPVAIVEYHGYNASDPYNTPAAASRISYYGITGFPTAEFDGGNPSVGGSFTQSLYSTYLPKVNARMNVASHFTLAASGSYSGNTASISAVINRVETDTNTNLRLHCVITESNIIYTWQNQPKLDFVQRAMIPSQTGTTIDFTAGETVTVPLSIPINPAWNLANCEMVLFLQNNQTKEILQGAKFYFPEIINAYPMSMADISFPETYLTNYATTPITITNFTSITATGSLTSSNPVFSVAPATASNFSIPSHQSLTFNVTFTPTSVGEQTGNLLFTSSIPTYGNVLIPLTGTGFANTAPTVANVAIAGIPVVSMDMTADYDYADADADSEGTTLYQWYRIVNGTPSLIPGATAAVYHLMQADIGYPVAVKVTPYDQHGMPGTASTSTASAIIETLPTPQNLTYSLLESVNVQLNWQAPNHFNGRNFLGYKVYRSDLCVATISNPSNTSFLDLGLDNGDYQYWVVAMFSNPIAISLPSNVVNVHLGPVSNDDNTVTAVEAMQVYPNPFHTTASILVSSKANSQVAARVFNAKGQLVATLNGTTDANGLANMVLENKGNLEAGIYFVTVKTNDKNLTHKIVMMK